MNKNSNVAYYFSASGDIDYHSLYGSQYAYTVYTFCEIKILE